jgi:hypothetical protein
MELHADRCGGQSGSSAKANGEGVAMRGIRHTAGSGRQRLSPYTEFPKLLPDKPFEPSHHRGSRRVFPRPARREPTTAASCHSYADAGALHAITSPSFDKGGGRPARSPESSVTQAASVLASIFSTCAKPG